MTGISYDTKTEYRVRLSIEERRVTTYDHGGPPRRSRWVKSGITTWERTGDHLNDALALFTPIKAELIRLNQELNDDEAMRPAPETMTRGEIINEISMRRPDLNIGWAHTGGGIMCMEIGRPGHDYEDIILVGHAGEVVGWSDYDGDAYGEFPGVSIDDWNASTWHMPTEMALKFIDNVADMMSAQFPTTEKEVTK